ncbi:MAG: GerMN domain-containing protein [Armatimonadetes bacterium]|nr:GerMN domain-containing protein [Armatimonadota bacterium]
MKRFIYFAVGIALSIGAAYLGMRGSSGTEVAEGRPQKAGSTVYLPAGNQGEPELKPKPLPIASRDKRRQAEAVIGALIKPGEGKKSPLPPGTRLRSVSVESDLATADFSRELVDNFPGGSQWESLVVESLVLSLTRIEGIRQVQILVEGEKVESLGEHIEIAQPLTREMVAPAR